MCPLFTSFSCMCHFIYGHSYHMVVSIHTLSASVYFISMCAHDDYMFSLAKPLASNPFISMVCGPKNSSSAIIDEVHLSIIQPYIWLANRIDDRALHWILIHQSWTWPWAVVIAPSDVSPAFLSLSLSFCLLLLLPLFAPPTFVSFCTLFSLPPTSPLLPTQLLYITDFLLSRFIVSGNL